MKRNITALLLCLALLSGRSQGLDGFLDRLDISIEQFKYSKLDTNYIAPPKYKLMTAVVSKNAWSHDNIHIPFSWNDADLYENYPGLEKYETEKIKSHTSLNSVGLRVSYCGFSFSYGISLNKSGNKRSFVLGSNGNKFGFKLGFEHNHLRNATFHDYRYLPLMYEFLNGLYELGYSDRPFTIDEIAREAVFNRSDFIDEKVDEKIGEDNDWELKDIRHWYANFYYAFNHRKFSMSASNYAQYIQKRSAGSLFVTGDVNYSRLHACDLLNMSEDSLSTSKENFNAFGVALGVGYGYNWTPNQGKFLLHGSLRPTVNVFNRMSYDAYEWVDDGEGHKVKRKMERVNNLDPLYDKKMKLSLGGVVRIAAVWNVTPRFVVGANMEYTTRDIRNASDFRLYHSSVDFNAYAAFRFVRSKIY